MVIRFLAELLPAGVVARARALVGLAIAYGLGKGGRNPHAGLTDDRELDCSGLVARALGIDRLAPGLIGGDWIWTNGMIADAAGPCRMFDPVPPGQIQPGDVVVIPGKRSKLTGRRIPGHCGIVVEAGPTIATCRIVHCHGPKGRSPAVEERDGRPWRHGIAIRFARDRVAAMLAKLRARVV